MCRQSICRILLAALAFGAWPYVAHAQTLTRLVEFEGPNGLDPDDTLVQGRDGELYGTTGNGGGYNGLGLIFSLSPAGLKGLNNFCGAQNCVGGASPGQLTLGTDGNFYGSTTYGGPRCGCGSIFKINQLGQLSYMYFFNFGFGVQPGALVEASDGNFYGTTYGGGNRDGYGTLFRITPNGVFQTLHIFSGPDGIGPLGLTQGSDGSLYGTTLYGGNTSCYSGCGTVFKTTLAGTLTTLHLFDNTNDGYSPGGGIIEATDGFFYGINNKNSTTENIFKMTPQGQVTILATVEGAGEHYAIGSLTQGSDTNLYGTTQYGGSNSLGDIFMVTLSGAVTELYSFTGPDGAYPVTTLSQATNGDFYGTTSGGGDNSCDPPVDGCGVAFSLANSLGPFAAFVRGYGRVGYVVEILGQGFTGTTAVEFAGSPAQFSVVSDTYLTATVPTGAATGFVTVATPTGTLKSNVPFRVLP